MMAAESLRCCRRRTLQVRLAPAIAAKRRIIIGPAAGLSHVHGRCAVAAHAAPRRKAAPVVLTDAARSVGGRSGAETVLGREARKPWGGWETNAGKDGWRRAWLTGVGVAVELRWCT